MSTLLTINVKNYQKQTQNFYFFQEPAIYSGGGPVYSNSLYSLSLGNYDDTGAILTFQVNMQFYAGIQQTHSLPQVGAASGFASASRPIDLTPKAKGSLPNNWTEASVAPLGLSRPKHLEGVQAGSFRIETPIADSPPYYNIGSAVSVNGGIVLSNFVHANPSNYTDCQPILKYYVQTGLYTPGNVMNFTQSSKTAAGCDFTGGYTVCDVELESNGKWSVELE